MSKHTPGPWHSVQPTFDREIMQAYFYICNDIEAKTIMDKYEHEANARLIAAAPLLLEACEDILLMIESKCLIINKKLKVIDVPFVGLKQAIKKAKGEV